ncbi:MAG: CstA-like carbon starvation protein [Bacillota bacterium]|nr:CstA-like carbon starvation protein [Bacillota bacterium]
MTTFLIGIIILVVGGYFYGAYCEKTFGPDERDTPAISKADGVDFVVMKKWKKEHSAKRLLDQMKEIHQRFLKQTELTSS